jgi:glycosyltransferase involved in cell wall biosynthesis
MAMMPQATIIIPCYNEAGTIEGLLDAIRRQSFPAGKMQVVVMDGGSTDGTREQLKKYAEDHPDLRLDVVDNPSRTIPSALNLGIRVAEAETIIRLDAHSVPYPDYVQRCLDSLDRTGAANVGGVWDIQPGGEGWIARSIAAAASHRLGAGDARYRTDGEPGWVETVPFGAYRAEWLQRVGPYNENLLTNEDYELNARLLKAGGKIWFDPTIRSIYYARSSLKELARQYLRYGYWKARMLHRYPDTLKWRQALPPLFVLGTFVLLGLSAFWPVGWSLLTVQWGGYGLALLAAGLREAARRHDAALALGFPLSVGVMHVCWGSAFLLGLVVPGSGEERGRIT